MKQRDLMDSIQYYPSPPLQPIFLPEHSYVFSPLHPPEPKIRKHGKPKIAFGALVPWALSSFPTDTSKWRSKMRADRLLLQLNRCVLQTLQIVSPHSLRLYLISISEMELDTLFSMWTHTK